MVIDRMPGTVKPGRAGPRLPPLETVVHAALLLVAVFVGAAFASSSWSLILFGAAALAGVFVTAAYAYCLNRAFNDTRRLAGESERRYIRLYDGIAAGVLSADATGRLRAANPALVGLLGYGSEAELLAVDFGEQVYAGPGTYAAVLDRVRAHGEVQQLEARLRRADGLTVTMLASVRALWDDAGEVNAFEATLLDVSGLKLAESQRRSMERRFRRLFDSNAVGIMFCNAKSGMLEEGNQRMLDLAGLRPSELPVSLEALVPEDQLALNGTLREALLRHGSIGPVPVEYSRADGRRVPVLISAALIEPMSGEFICVVIDRTAEVAAARAVSEMRGFYELLLDEVPTLIASHDLDQRFTYCNHAYRQWLGLGEPPIGRTLLELIGPERYGAAAAPAALALTGETVRFEAEVRRDGRRHVMEVTYVPQRAADGSILGFLSFINDRTQEASGSSGSTGVRQGERAVAGDTAAVARALRSV